MEPFWVGIIGLVLLLVMLFGGVYVAVALGLVGVLGMIIIVGFPAAMGTLFYTLFHTGTKYGFIVIPLFIAMGLFSSEAGVSRQIYDTLSKWVGHVKAGLGLATVGGATIFGVLTGSSIVTSIVFAKVSVPEMVRHGYDKKVAYGLVSACGAIGMMIPPSLLVVVYAILTDESIGRLLMGGIGPGLVLALCLGGGLVLLLKLRPSLGPPARVTGVTWRERIVSLPKLWPALIVGGIIIGGIYSGIFTATEAAGFGTFTLFVFYLVSKRFSMQSWKVLINCLRETVGMSVMILFLIASARVFARLLVLAGIGPMLTESIVGLDLSGFQFLLVIALLYLVLGTFLDSVSVLAITVPLFYPAIQAMGLDPIWVAMVMILGSQVGNVTPPVGLQIYAVKGVAGEDISLEDLFRGVLPFFLMMVVAHVIIIAFPVISTWIPSQLK